LGAPFKPLFEFARDRWNIVGGLKKGPLIMGGPIWDMDKFPYNNRGLWGKGAQFGGVSGNHIPGWFPVFLSPRGI